MRDEIGDPLEAWEIVIEVHHQESGQVFREVAMEGICHRCEQQNWVAMRFIACPNCQSIEFTEQPDGNRPITKVPPGPEGDPEGEGTCKHASGDDGAGRAGTFKEDAEADDEADGEGTDREVE